MLRGKGAWLAVWKSCSVIWIDARESAAIPDATAFQPGEVREMDLPFPRARTVTVPANTAVAIVAWAPAGDLRRAVEVGMEIQRLRAVLAAEGLATAWIEVGAGQRLDADVPKGGVPLGVLAIGHGSLPSL